MIQRTLTSDNTKAQPGIVKSPATIIHFKQEFKLHVGSFTVQQSSKVT